MRRAAGILVLAVVLVVGIAGTAASAGAQQDEPGQWRVQHPPIPHNAANFDAVSCTTRSWCMAVGYYEVGPYLQGAYDTLAESWNGTRWTVVPTPNPTTPKGDFVSLDEVSCSSSAACTAVGSAYGNSNKMMVIVERWNGVSWALENPATPFGGTQVSLVDVSCVTTGDCEAVGSYVTSAKADVTLAEVWHGSAWAVQQTPNPTAGLAKDLSAVSCVSATQCMAVGSVSNANTAVGKTLAEAWDGNAWSIVPTPTPADALFINLPGLSCPGPALCVAAGSYATTSQFSSTTLMLAWNGTVWSTVTTPAVSDAAFGGISCASVRACTAVGESGVGPPIVTLIEVWNGTTWVLRPSPNPGGSQIPGTNFLNGVSCTSAETCTAVGWYTGDESPVGSILAIRHR